MVEGFSNILNQFKPTGGNNQGYPGSFILTARVNSIILNENDEGWEEYGEYASIGYITFSDPTINNPTSKNLAKPLFPNQKYYPVLNEIVYIIGIPSQGLNENPTLIEYYYFQPVNIWNSNHHNALPDEIFTEQLPDSQQQDYPTVGLGAVRRVTDESTEINLGKTFFERTNIKTLQPYEGDYILEGRWGNSIRFGSTVVDSTPKNTWSESGINGDPLIIIRNGQYENGQNPWIPTVEDINQDSGSIYLTTTQKLPINVASSNYNSYTSYTPTLPNQYNNPQIILNSGRLLFNSTTDHILLSSALTIGFNAVKGFNFDTKANFVINAPSIKLGGKEAKEPILKGDATIAELSDLVQELISLATVMATVVHPSFTPVTSVIPSFITKLTEINTNLLTKTKSTYSKTL